VPQVFSSYRLPATPRNISRSSVFPLVYAIQARHLRFCFPLAPRALRADAGAQRCNPRAARTLHFVLQFGRPRTVNFMLAGCRSGLCYGLPVFDFAALDLAALDLITPYKSVARPGAVRFARPLLRNPTQGRLTPHFDTARFGKRERKRNAIRARAALSQCE
jgi:hypothetical protein